MDVKLVERTNRIWCVHRTMEEEGNNPHLGILEQDPKDKRGWKFDRPNNDMAPDAEFEAADLEAAKLFVQNNLDESPPQIDKELDDEGEPVFVTRRNINSYRKQIFGGAWAFAKTTNTEVEYALAIAEHMGSVICDAPAEARKKLRDDIVEIIDLEIELHSRQPEVSVISIGGIGGIFELLRKASSRQL